MTPVRRSIYSIFEKFARESPEKRFLFDEEQSFTAREAFNAAVSAANRLYSLGVREGTLAALRATRSADTAILIFALTFLGAVTALTDPHDTAEGYLIDTGLDIRPEVTLTNEPAGGGLAASGGWLVSGRPFEIERPEGEVFPQFPTETDILAPSLIVFTSGSTGRAKGVMLSQYNLVNHLVNYAPCGDYKEEDVSVETLPLNHVFGLSVILMGLYTRYCVFFPKSVEAGYVARCIEKYGITRLDGVPGFALAVANRKMAAGGGLSSLRVGVVGGAPLSRRQFDFIEETLGLRLLPVYGLSECIGISGAGPEVPRDRRADSVGKSLAMNEVFILDGDGAETGGEGEICVRGPAVMAGYYGGPQVTAEAFDSQGRLHTGDLGYVDGEGYLHVSGRKKDVIIRNGVNISAVKVQKAIESLGFVSSAAVVGIEDERLGEAPAALVVRRGEGDIMAGLRALLPKNELPLRILEAEKIPKTASGKVDRAAVKRLFTGG